MPTARINFITVSIELFMPNLLKFPIPWNIPHSIGCRKTTNNNNEVIARGRTVVCNNLVNSGVSAKKMMSKTMEAIKILFVAMLLDH